MLPSIVLGGAAIIVVQAYADYQPRGSWWLAVYLLIAILLAGRIHYLNNQDDWSRRRVFVNEESWPNILGSLFVTAGAAILIAWLLPTSRASLQAAVDTWKNVSSPIRDRLSNAVASLSGPYGKPTGNFYGGTLAHWGERSLRRLGGSQGAGLALPKLERTLLLARPCLRPVSEWAMVRVREIRVCRFGLSRVT